MLSASDLLDFKPWDLVAGKGLVHTELSWQTVLCGLQSDTRAVLHSASAVFRARGNRAFNYMCISTLEKNQSECECKTTEG